MSRQQIPSLDLTGMEAAVYPSEDTLWAYGPPTNPQSQGSQGQALPTPGAQTPRSAADVANMEALTHEQLYGETSNHPPSYYGIVPLDEHGGPTGYGPYNNEGVWESGHTQIIQSNPSAEQGWGVGPARRWAHYPIEDLPNPWRNRMVHMRNGELPWVTESSYLYERSQLAAEEQWSPYIHRSPVSPVVNVPTSVPFVTTVPTFGGGPLPVPGLDVPEMDNPAFGIYPQ